MTCGTLWSSEEDARLRAAAAAGKHVDAASLDLPGRTEEAIYKRARRLRLHFARKAEQSTVWPAESVEQLRRLWNVEQLSASECAKQLAVSRNAVIGKARRLNLTRRASPIKRRKRVWSSFLNIIRPACEYIFGEPRDGKVCGQPCKPGTAYCEKHYAKTRGRKYVMSPEEVRIRSERAKANNKAARVNSFLFGG